MVIDRKPFQEILADGSSDALCAVSDVLLLSYSLNPEVLNEVLMESGLVNRYKGESELAEHVTCRIQSDRYQCGEGGDPVDLPFAAYVIETGRVKGIKKQGKSYHPKLIALLKENGTQVQLIISSRNLTKTSMLEGVLCLEGEVKDGTGRNQELIDFLTKISDIEKDNAVVQALGKADFSESIKRICCDDDKATVEFCSQHLEDKLLEDLKGAEKATVVSPFLGSWEFLDKFIQGRPENTFQIITNRQIAPASVPKGQTEAPTYFKYPKNEQIKLHAKLYAVDRENNYSVLYIGSANFSENGLERNNELMCRITSEKCRFAEAVRNSFGELECCEIVDSPGDLEEPEPTELPVFKLSDQEREALEEKMQEALGKAQLTEAFRRLFGSANADAPLEGAIRKRIEMNGNNNSCPDVWDFRMALFRLYASTCREDVKAILRELCDNIE